MLIFRKYILFWYCLKIIIYQISANKYFLNSLNDNDKIEEYTNSSESFDRPSTNNKNISFLTINLMNNYSINNDKDYLVTKSDLKENIVTYIEDENYSNIDNDITTIASTITSQTDKPISEESVVSNYTLCEDLTYEDLKEDMINNENKIDVKYTLSSSSTSPDQNFTVEDLEIKFSNDSSLTVAWKPKKGYDVQSYIVEWYNNKNDKKLVAACRTNNETFEYTITHLSSCTTYEVRVFPATNGTLGHHKLVIDSTALIVDKDTLKLRVTESGATWIKISWNLPNNDCIKENIINYCNFNNCQSINNNLTSSNVTNLIPCTDYNFTLTIIQNGESGSTDVSGSTEFMKPGTPALAGMEAKNNSLMVNWTVPIGENCISFYQITLNRPNVLEDTITVKTEKTSIIFKNLKSCSVYEIIILPVDRNGNESLLALVNSTKTLAPIPEIPHFKSTSSTNHSITITWSLLLNEFNDCESIKILTQCNSNKVLGHGYDGINGSSLITIPDKIIKFTTDSVINNLSPYTEYNCSSIAFNSQGNSSSSEIVLLQTWEDVPSSPFLSVHNLTDKQFALSWEIPKYLPGYLTMFEVNFTWFYKFHQPSWCENVTKLKKTITNIAGNLSSLIYNNTSPYSFHKASIRAKTRAGWGNYSDDIEFTTLPGAPGPISNLSFVLYKNPFDPNILDAFLIWGLPCFIHGPKIDQFNITGMGQRKNFEHHNFEFMTATSGTCENDICKKKLILRDEYSYVFYVAGKVKDFKGLGKVKNISYSFPAGIPPEPPVNYTNYITIDPFKARRTTSTASILLPLFPNINGDIKCYAVIVAKAGYNNGSFSRINTNPEDFLDMASWFESKQTDFTIPYQAIKFCDNTHYSYIVDYGRLKAVKFVIGEDMETCEELSSKKNERSYCNGPLNSDEWYDVRMRAFTSGGYRDSKIFVIKTNAEIQVSVVVGSILGVLFLGILITMMLLIRKCSLQIVIRRFLHSDMPGSPVPAPFTRRKFIIHCQQLADNPGKLSNEFQLLQTLSVDLQMPTNAACLQANRKKNRYTDVLPYDFSRVKLDIVDNDPNSDYINASFIKGFSGEEEYIACQGPKEETTYDFWRMIDQYDVKLIIMLTQLVEKNKEKCHQYYPTIRETFTYETMSIRCSSELDYRTYTQRTLILQKDDEKRSITHLHFKDWPDHDVPEDYDPMINFCQTVRRNVAINRGIAVIHCSAGIGRTGTLIAIDILLQHMKENRKLDVFGTVYRLRHHRINMVQRESQYAYIYNCIKQVLKNPYFSKNYKPPSVDPITDNNFNNKKNDNSMTNLVSSLETLKKNSLSSSIQSTEEILQSSILISLSSLSPSSSALLPSSSLSSSILKTPKTIANPKKHKLKNNLFFNKDHQLSKSTSAININSIDNQIVRYNTINYPINKINRLYANEKQLLTSLPLLEKSSGDNVTQNHSSILQRFFKSTTEIKDPVATQKLLNTSF